MCIRDRCVAVDGDAVSVSSMDNPEQFESRKLLKETMEQGIKL